MPCRGPDPKEIRAMQRKELDLLTRIVCFYVESLTDQARKQLFKNEPELRRWHERHEAFDELRRESEAKKAKKAEVLGTLTPEQVEALGGIDAITQLLQ